MKIMGFSKTISNLPIKTKHIEFSPPQHAPPDAYLDIILMIRNEGLMAHKLLE